MDWENSLSYAENLELAGYDDWRLPNAKELQSIVDYNRSISATNSAAIDPIFQISQIQDMEGNIQYPSDEIEKSIRTTLILLFAGVNGCILIPYTSKTLAKVKQNEINSKDLQKKILIILVLIILIVLVEKNYMADTQEGILKVFNQLMEK